EDGIRDGHVTGVQTCALPIYFEGNVVVPLDEAAVRRALRRMKLQGVDSLAVVFLFSFVNPAHERRVREIAAEELPDAMLSLSHQIGRASGRERGCSQGGRGDV